MPSKIVLVANIYLDKTIYNMLQLDDMRAFFVTIFIVLSFALFSEADVKNMHEFSYGIEADLSRKGRLEAFSYLMNYGFSISKFSSGLGVKTGSDSISGTVYGKYSPLKLKYFSLGVHAIYNLNLFTGYCIENNFLLGANLSAGKLDKVLFSFDISYLLKLTGFYKLSIIPLIDNTLALSLKLESLIKDKFLLAFKIASYSMHNYPLFFTPIFSLETAWILSPEIRLNNFFSVKYSDMFTLTSYLSNMMMGISVVFKIPPKKV